MTTGTRKTTYGVCSVCAVVIVIVTIVAVRDGKRGHSRYWYTCQSGGGSYRSGWEGLTTDDLSDGTSEGVLLKESRVLYAAPYTSNIALRSRENGQLIQEWRLSEGWLIGKIDASDNREVGVIACVRGGFRASECRMGVVSGKALKWLPQWAPSSEGVGPQAIAVSNNGEYVAVAGTICGDTVSGINTTSGKIWHTTPKAFAGICDIVFTYESEWLAVTDVTGRVCMLDVRKGQMSKMWNIGQEGVGRGQWCKFSRIAVSPNGRHVAVGSGPDGRVFLVDRVRDSVCDVLDTKCGTILGLAFSGDSNALAVCGIRSRKVDVWRISCPSREKRTGSSSGDR